MASLEGLLLAALGLFPALFLVPLWRYAWVLAHECAHWLVALALRVRMIEFHVGGGARVMWLRAFGSRWLFRLAPTSGKVVLHWPTGALPRLRMAAVYLAGPLATTGAAVLVAWSLRRAVPYDDESALTWFVAPTCLLCLADLSLQALVAWWPKAGTDLALLFATLRMTPPDDDSQRRIAAGHRMEHAWRRFLAGDAAGALAAWDALDDGTLQRWERLLARAVYVWPVDGAVAASAVLAEAEAELGEWERIETERNPHAAETIATLVRGARVRVLVNRAFFVLDAEGSARAKEAERWLEEAAKLGKGSEAVLRTSGLAALYAGDLEHGLWRLRHAFLLESSPWERALCALYLAWGHALGGKHGEASELLEKARSLHPESFARKKYERLVAELRANG